MPIGRPPKLAGLEPEIIAAYKAGASVTELAQRHGVSNQPIRRILSRAGVTRSAHRPRSLTAAQVDEAVDLWHAEWSMAAIGRHLYVSPYVIRTELQARGIDTTSRLIVRRAMDIRSAR